MQTTNRLTLRRPQTRSGLGCGRSFSVRLAIASLLAFAGEPLPAEDASVAPGGVTPRNVRTWSSTSRMIAPFEGGATDGRATEAPSANATMPETGPVLAEKARVAPSPADGSESVRQWSTVNTAAMFDSADEVPYFGSPSADDPVDSFSAQAPGGLEAPGAVPGFEGDGIEGFSPVSPEEVFDAPPGDPLGLAPDGSSRQPPSFRSDVQFGQVFGSGDGLGITELDIRLIAGKPKRQKFAIGAFPAFGAHWLEGPDSTDLPGALFDVVCDVSGMYSINERWRVMMGVTPGYFGDFETSTDGFRIPARLLAFWTRDPTLTIAFGVVYFDREDISVLPAAGLVWKPRPDLTLDLMFPRPRLSYRLSAAGTIEKWVYLAGEFGGGSWAIRRQNGSDDVVTYSALRLLVGYERRNLRGLSPRIEAGYAFDRQIEYKSGIGDFDPDSTGFIRFGCTY